MSIHALRLASTEPQANKVTWTLDANGIHRTQDGLWTIEQEGDWYMVTDMALGFILGLPTVTEAKAFVDLVIKNPPHTPSGGGGGSRRAA